MKKQFLLTVGAMALVAVTSSRGEDLALDGFQPPLRHTWDQPRSGVDNARVVLGKALYFDKRLSKDNSLSCNSCHDLKRFGVDGRGFSLGFENHEVGRNSPTVFNAFGHITQFWDGRAPTVEEQAKGPILAAGEMAMPSPEAVVKKLKGIPGYKPMFEAAFPGDKDPVNYDNVGTAIGAFERLLVTPSRWDSFLSGAEKALSPLEQQGVKAFTSYGCTTCHTGTLLGGDRYMKAGLVKPWPNQKDLGRFGVTGNEADKLVFKVPSLRNIEKTGPYFHDASETTLDGAIRKMGRHQLGVEIPKKDVAAIKAFLQTLTADIPAELAATPEMPGAVVSKSFD
ncbi:MAG: cytochrome-c peroxidase [Verrucomicrobiae bacterium]|nr:cytochrome-c peroxidase [Verrucomicrobiae bacterium]